MRSVCNRCPNLPFACYFAGLFLCVVPVFHFQLGARKLVLWGKSSLLCLVCVSVVSPRLWSFWPLLPVLV